MNVHLLIDAVVRQTTVLIAQLATSGGARAALGHTANQIFLDLAGELRRQGLSNKLIADLFGVSLRTYHNKVRRLSESSTDRGRPLWNAVLDFVQSQGTVSRAEALMRFCKDDAATVRSVLLDLVEAGLIFAKGRGDSLVYRAAQAHELGTAENSHTSDTIETLLWVIIARQSPVEYSELLDAAQVDQALADAALQRLIESGKVQERTNHGVREFTSDECVVSLGQALGWEASVFDHYQAVVTAICAKLALGNSRSERGEQVGGSTYSMDVWPGHPLFDEAQGLLQSLRDRAASLRSRVDQLNQTLNRPTAGVRRVVAYVGQNVVDTSPGELDLENET